MEMSYLKGLLESLIIALECNDLARQGDYEAIRQKLLCG